MTESSHADWEALAAGYALHALEPGEEQEFERHLAGCARCADALDEHAAVAAALADLGPQEQPPPEVWAGIRTALEAEGVRGFAGGPARPVSDARNAGPRGVPTAVPTGTALPTGTAGPTGTAVPTGTDAGAPEVPAQRAARPWWQRRDLLVAAAAVLAIVIGIGSWQATGPGGRTGGSTQALVTACSSDPACQVVHLSGAHQASATVLVRSGQARVLAAGLPALPGPYETYVLWQMPRDGAPTGLLAFGRTDDAPPVDLKVPLTRTAAFAISREPGHAIPASPTTVVATGAAGA